MNTYFITFSTYGTRLHGDPRGTVDRDHNTLGEPFVEANESWVAHGRDLLTQAPYLLDPKRRAVVLAVVCQHAAFRGWCLLAAHVRSNHVHIVIRADVQPERVMSELKAYASRALNESGFDPPDRLRWTRHGSTLWLKSEEAVAEKVRYIAFEQGAVLSMFVAPLG